MEVTECTVITRRHEATDRRTVAVFLRFSVSLCDYRVLRHLRFLASRTWRSHMRLAVIALLLVVLAAPARAQFVPTPVAEPETAVDEVSLSGPRFGFTHLSDGIVRR